MNARDNGPRYPGFRNSVDICTAAITPRSIRSPKRSSRASAFSSPHFITIDADAVSAGPRSATSTSTSSSSSTPTKPIMSFLSRFGHKSKNRLSVNTDKPGLEHKNVTHTHTRGNSLPNTPVGGHQHKDSNGSASIKHRISSPVLETTPTNTLLTRTESTQTMDHGISWRPALEQYPLCVARIQAIRTTLLPQCTMSTEKLLRRDGAVGTSKRDRRTSRVLPRSHAPTKSADMQWTKGLYVLMPGMILRYSGYGTEDRLPERALVLTAGSLAFASDIIPGRPWVLQITRGGDEGVVAPKTTGSLTKRHSLMSKVTFQGNSVSSKAAHSIMFMVFESAEEMEEWMKAVRQEAMRLGGGSRPSISQPPVLEEEEDPTIVEEEHLGNDPPRFDFGTLNSTVTTLPSMSEEGTTPTTPYSPRAATYPNFNATDTGAGGFMGLARDDPPNSLSDEGLSKRASTYTRESYSSVPSSSQPSSSHGGNPNQLSSSISSSAYSPNRMSVISADRASLDFLRSSARPMTRIPSTTVTTVSPDTSPERSTSPHSTPYRQSGSRHNRYSRSSCELRIPPAIPSPGVENQSSGNNDQPTRVFWMPRTPSPQPGEWGRRASAATTKTTISTASNSLSPPTHRPARRPVSMFPPYGSTPVRRPSIRRRSLGAMTTHVSYGHHHSGHSLVHPPNRRLNSDQPISLLRHRSREPSRDESRDDVLELGGPKFPPPSIPLPKVPDMKGERRGSRRERARRRRASASTEASVRTHRTSETAERSFFTGGSSVGDHITPSPTPMGTPLMKPHSIIVESPPPFGLEISRRSYSSTPSSTPPAAAAVHASLRLEHDNTHDSRFSASKRRSFIDDLRDLELGDEEHAQVHRREMEREREERSEMRRSFAGMTPPARPPESPYGGPGSEALGIGSVWI